LVTGATGMLGTRLVFDLLEQGLAVRAIYRNKSRLDQFRENLGYHTSNVDELFSKVDWVEADLLNYSSIFSALEGAAMVYHCAAMVSFYPADKAAMYETNIGGTRNLVNACLETGVNKLCHVSSIAALGKTDNGDPVNEETSWIPEKKHSGYSISKFHSEMEVWRGINEGMEAVIVNPSIILGPGDWLSGSPAFFEQIHKGLKFYTTGVTGFVDVRDVTAAMLLLCSDNNWVHVKGNRFVINAVNKSYLEIFTMIAKELQVKPPSVKAGKLMLSLAWRMAWLAGKLTGIKPLITRDSVQSAGRQAYFDGSKISRVVGLKYRPIDETIKEVGAMFRKCKELRIEN
jgi:dihydroflavonol-4-reductase